MSTAAPAPERRDPQLGYRARGVELVLRRVSIAIAPVETDGLVGASGCGKSTAAFAAGTTASLVMGVSLVADGIQAALQ